MAGYSTGVFTIPRPVLSGSEAPSGIYTIPMFVMEGSSGSRGEPFVIPQFQFTGTSISRAIHGEFKLPVPIMSGIGLRTTKSSGIFVLPKISITGRSLTGSHGTFVLPQFVFSDIVPGYSRGSFEIPIPVYEGFGHGIPILKIYRGVVANLFNQAISTYNNFRFNSLAYFDGQYLGANENGIFVLGGDRDNDQRILSRLKTGTTDFGDNFIKNALQAWLTYRSDGHLSVTFSIDEDNKESSTSITQITGSKMHEERVKSGRGLKSRFYTIEIQNISGADFDIDSLSILVEAIRRKIR